MIVSMTTFYTVIPCVCVYIFIYIFPIRRLKVPLAKISLVLLYITVVVDDET